MDCDLCHKKAVICSEDESRKRCQDHLAAKDIFLNTIEVMKEEINDAGERTFFIRSKISIDGKHWEDAVVMWSDTQMIKVNH